MRCATPRLHNLIRIHCRAIIFISSISLHVDYVFHTGPHLAPSVLGISVRQHPAVNVTNGGTCPQERRCTRTRRLLHGRCSHRQHRAITPFVIVGRSCGPTARALDKLCVVTSHDPLPRARLHIVDDCASVPSE